MTGSRRLAARAVAGDERAFATIYERHHQELYRYCLAIVRREADAEDALQATMTKALRSLPGEGREIDLRPWLFRVAHNEAISILRTRSSSEVELDGETAGGTGPAEQLERSERLRTLVADLKQLPDRQRSALVMRELSGLGYSEIATALDCGEGAARQTVYEARAALQTREQGRQMLCAEARRALSDGDRRRLRGRKLRAHLGACESCRDFEAAIGDRRRDLAALCPPLPAAAAAGILGGLLGSGGGAGVGAGAGASGVLGGVGSAAGVKAASLTAAVAVAVGGAGASGVIDLPGPLGRDNPSKTSAPAPSEQPVFGPSTATAPASGGQTGSRSTDAGGRSRDGGSGRSKGKSASTGHDRGDGSRKGKSGGNDNSNTAPGQAANPGTGGPPDNSSAGGQGNGIGVPGGGKESAPGQTGAAPGQSGSPPGQSGSSPGQSGSAPGRSQEPGPPVGSSPPNGSGGGSSTAPGQTNVPPSGSNAGGNGQGVGQGKGKVSADTP